ncbi:hypothetical protein ZEAMMB73_Zm00001d040780 [Zea mays]|nr:hypothetical protein ZEAMMB73_Zm00001d040780 [Zea mays]
MLAKGEPLLYWCRKALVSCVVSALLTFYVYFMLCQWPGGQRDRTLTVLLQEPVVSSSADQIFDV